MSKKQWGHGFHNGYKKAKKESSDVYVNNGVKLIENAELICPTIGCESPFLHHFRIEVYDREKEDSWRGRTTIIDNCGVFIRNNDEQSMFGNPSIRRDGIRILFWCEWCEMVSIIEFDQHKGSTCFSLESTTRKYRGE